MPHRFKKHYTIEEARTFLPELRNWLEELASLSRQFGNGPVPDGTKLRAGHDLGGELVNRWLINLARYKALFAEFERCEIEIKDIERGLVDFPAFVHGREVFLCWEKCEEDITHWHELDAGYAGREPLDE